MPSGTDDAQALDAIAAILRNRYWDAGDVIYTIADLVRDTGRAVGSGERD